MGLLDDYERIDKGRELSQWKVNITNYVQSIRERKNLMIAIKNDYPGDAAEIDALLAQLKTALTNLANEF